MPRFAFAIAVAGAAASAQPVESQPLSTPAPTYADLADLALAAPVAAHVEIERTRRLGERDATNVPPGHRRFLIEGRVVALIRGPGLAPRVSWLVDIPNDARGRPARIARRSQWLVFAQPVPGRPDDLRLVASDSMIAFSPAAAERVRSVLRESAAADPPPRIVGIGRAFHVPGSLPGESETQIFLRTEEERPISIVVLRRPGETPRWSVALGEMIDDAAAPPRPETLLWYRLACTLPQSLPAQSLADAGPREAQAIRADYGLVLERLGPCARGRR